MPTRKNSARHHELVEDADGALRALSRRFPEALPQTRLRPGEQLASARWRETQVAVPQVRMDRVVEVGLVGGSSRLLHGEWTERLTSEVLRRMGKYHLAVALAELGDVEAAEKCWQGAEERQRLESMIVVLRGRKKPWPREGAFRTTPNDTKFGGAWFYIDPVYQRTVAELEARGSPFWLAFVPLAIDVNEEKLRSIIKGLRNQVGEEDFDELVGTMLSLTKLKKDPQPFMDVIRSAAKKEKPMHPFMRDGLEQGMERGLQRGLAFFIRAFERRLGRSVTDAERRRLGERFEKDRPDLLVDAVFDFTPEQLATWLAPRKSAKRTRGSNKTSRSTRSIDQQT